MNYIWGRLGQAIKLVRDKKFKVLDSQKTSKIVDKVSEYQKLLSQMKVSNIPWPFFAKSGL